MKTFLVVAVPAVVREHEHFRQTLQKDPNPYKYLDSDNDTLVSPEQGAETIGCAFRRGDGSGLLEFKTGGATIVVGKPNALIWLSEECGDTLQLRVGANHHRYRREPLTDFDDRLYKWDDREEAADPFVVKVIGDDAPGLEANAWVNPLIVSFSLQGRSLDLDDGVSRPFGRNFGHNAYENRSEIFENGLLLQVAPVLSLSDLTGAFLLERIYRWRRDEAFSMHTVDCMISGGATDGFDMQQAIQVVANFVLGGRMILGCSGGGDQGWSWYRGEPVDVNAQWLAEFLLPDQPTISVAPDSAMRKLPKISPLGGDYSGRAYEATLKKIGEVDVGDLDITSRPVWSALRALSVSGDETLDKQTRLLADTLQAVWDRRREEPDMRLGRFYHWQELSGATILECDPIALVDQCVCEVLRKVSWRMPLGSLGAVGAEDAFVDWLHSVYLGGWRLLTYLCDATVSLEARIEIPYVPGWQSNLYPSFFALAPGGDVIFLPGKRTGMILARSRLGEDRLGGTVVVKGGYSADKATAM